MSLQTAPYNDSMRIGSGFNSYTQQLCIDNAVVKGDKSPATEDDLKPNLNGTSDDDVSQKVSFTSKFVESSSDITDAMNVSGHLEIKVDGIGVSGSASYIDSSKVKDSDINYFVQVKVVNQHLIPEDLSRFNSIANVSATDRGRFTEIYGDSFISGFLEGGEFNALLSVKVADKSKVKTIKGALSLSLSAAGFGISGGGEGGYDKEEILKNSETSITVSWTGGGQIQDETSKDNGWSVESMAKAAFSFADRVRVCPQRTQATITKYSALRSYQLQTNKGSPLDYENAGVYTNALLESYMEYKTIAKGIQKMTQQLSAGEIKLGTQAGSTDAASGIKKLKESWKLRESGSEETFANIPDAVYKPDIFGLEEARLDCRLQRVLIVKEVDEVANNPEVAVDPHRVGQFLNPLIFRKLLPASQSFNLCYIVLQDKYFGDNEEKSICDSISEAGVWEVNLVGYNENGYRQVNIKSHTRQKYFGYYPIYDTKSGKIQKWDLDWNIPVASYGVWDLIPAKESTNRFNLAAKLPDGTYYVLLFTEGYGHNFRPEPVGIKQPDNKPIMFISADAVV